MSCLGPGEPSGRVWEPGPRPTLLPAHSLALRLLKAFWPPDARLQAISPGYFELGALIFCHFGRSRETKRSALLLNRKAASRAGPALTSPSAGSAPPLQWARPDPELPLLSPAGQLSAVLLLAAATGKQEANNRQPCGASNRSERGGGRSSWGCQALTPLTSLEPKVQTAPQGHAAHTPPAGCWEQH